MRLPELSGYRLEKLMGEDPFGWSFLAGKGENDKRLIRILKSQATLDQSIGGIYRHIAALQHSSGIATVDKFSQRMVGMPSAISCQFPGWKAKSGNWTLSSVAYLSRVIDKDGALLSASKIFHTLGDLHRKGIYHGGLRPENIFLTTGQGDEPEVKITGFGEMVTPGLQLIEAASLPFYLAPEQFIHNGKTEDKVALWDVYSAGVIIYYLLSKHLPRLDRLFRQYWSNPDQMDRLVLVSQGKLTRNAGQIYLLLESEKDLVWPDQHSSDTEKLLRAVVEKCLAFDPEQRFRNMADVSDALRHAEQLLAEKEIRESAALATAPPQPVVQEETPQVSTHLKAPSTGKVPQKEAKTSPPRKQKGYESLDQIFSDTDSEKSAPKTKGFIGKIPLIRQFRSSPILDKAIAAVIVLGLGGLGVTTLSFHTRLGETEKQRIKAVSDLQDNIKKQANKFQQTIALTKESAAEVKEDLNAAEDTKARLIGEANLARGLLRETQDSGDQFFKLILENRDTDVPAFRNQRKAALEEGKKHYQHLIEIYGEVPDFAVQTANSHYYLGRIYNEMGEMEDAAKSFQAAEERYEKLMEEERNAQFTENLAVSKRELGNLALRNGAFAQASNFFDQSTQRWRELGNLDSSRVIDSSIEVNLNSLRIVECHRALGNREDALTGARDLASSFMGMRDRYPNDERIIGGLARSFEMIGMLFENYDRDKAVQAFGQARDLYAEAIKKNAAVDRYHLGLGNCLARSGLLTNDIKKLNASIEILARVIPRNPNEPSSVIALADVFGVLSGNQRDGGKVANAIAIEERAIELLRPIMQNNKSVPVEAYHAYSKRLVHLAELRVDANKFDSSRIPLKEAIDILAGITKAANAPPNYRRTLATARGLAGFASLQSKDKTSAKSYYAMAVEDWTAYISQNPNDADAANNARWARDQLRALQ